jgi:tight adherence protein C
MELGAVVWLAGIALAVAGQVGAHVPHGGRVRQRLRRLAGSQAPWPAPWRERVWPVVLGALSRAVARLLPSHALEGVRRQMARAGQGHVPAETVVALSLLWALAGAGAGIALAQWAGAPLSRTLLLAVAGSAVGLLGASYRLARSVSRRQRQVTRALPDFLDLLAVTVEAGLGLEAALSKVTQNRTDPLSQEIQLTLARLRYGQTLGQSLRHMARRLDHPDVTRLCEALAQSQDLGTSLADTLRSQSQLLRELRRLRAEEQAARVPVKMLFPMVVFILPALFLLLLGPAVLRMLHVFGGHLA